MKGCIMTAIQLSVIEKVQVIIYKKILTFFIINAVVCQVLSQRHSTLGLIRFWIESSRKWILIQRDLARSGS